MLLLIALVLDPRRKFKFVAWMVNRIYNSEDAASLKAKLESCLKSIYEEYSGGLVSPLGNSTNQLAAFDEVYDDPYGCFEFYQTVGCSTSDSELSQYIQEDIERRPLDFDILAWWKVNSSRFPILASIAREVLAIPISTVASESAFSTGGRILDPYRSSLTPTTVEALVCTQDWLEESSSSYLPSDDFEFLEQLEQELPFAQDVASCSVSIALDDDCRGFFEESFEALKEIEMYRGGRGILVPLMKAGLHQQFPTMTGFVTGSKIAPSTWWSYNS